MERTLALQQGTWTPTDHCPPRSQSSSRAGTQALTTRPASPVTEPAESCCCLPGGHSPQPLSFLSRVTCVMTTQAAGVEGDLGHRSPLLRWPFLRTFFSCVHHWLSPAQGTDWLAQQLSWWPSSEPARAACPGRYTRPAAALPTPTRPRAISSPWALQTLLAGPNPRLSCHPLRLGLCPGRGPPLDPGRGGLQVPGQR